MLHDLRGLSVHFMLDLDGTIYQTLDLKEGAWHATIANGRSIGIEIANIGAYPVGRGRDAARPLVPDGATTAGPHHDPRAGPTTSGVRDPRPSSARSATSRSSATIQGQELRQYDLTPQQYDSLIRLTATLCTRLPQDPLRLPARRLRQRSSRTSCPTTSSPRYQGVLGHYHVQTNKVDPGPAFQWDRVISGGADSWRSEARFARSLDAGEGPRVPTARPFIAELQPPALVDPCDLIRPQARAADPVHQVLTDRPLLRFVPHRGPVEGIPSGRRKARIAVDRRDSPLDRGPHGIDVIIPVGEPMRLEL